MKMKNKFFREQQKLLEQDRAAGGGKTTATTAANPVVKTAATGATAGVAAGKASADVLSKAFRQVAETAAGGTRAGVAAGDPGQAQNPGQGFVWQPDDPIDLLSMEVVPDDSREGWTLRRPAEIRQNGGRYQDWESDTEPPAESPAEDPSHGKGMFGTLLDTAWDVGVWTAKDIFEDFHETYTTTQENRAQSDRAVGDLIRSTGENIWESIRGNQKTNYKDEMGNTVVEERANVYYDGSFKPESRTTTYVEPGNLTAFTETLYEEFEEYEEVLKVRILINGLAMGGGLALAGSGALGIGIGGATAFGVPAGYSILALFDDLTGGNGQQLLQLEYYAEHGIPVIVSKHWDVDGYLTITVEEWQS